VAAEEINYRHFFDINELVALRAEDLAVFAATHHLVLRLFAEGQVTGLRIDHIDGLYDPATYLQRLQRACLALRAGALLPAHLSEQSRHSRDFTLSSLTHAIREIIACFPVYRTYIDDNAVTERDRATIELAVARAKRKNPATDASVFNFVRDVLLLRVPHSLR